jgi:hypothetical protein
MPLSLPDARWPTWPARRASGGFAPCKGTVLVRIAAATRSHTVEPSRLAFGAWCHASEKQIGEGDIRASYSADRIGMGQPIRKPFRYAGALWVCVGTGPSGAEA